MPSTDETRPEDERDRGRRGPGETDEHEPDRVDEPGPGESGAGDEPSPQPDAYSRDPSDVPDLNVPADEAPHVTDGGGEDGQAGPASGWQQSPDVTYEGHADAEQFKMVPDKPVRPDPEPDRPDPERTDDLAVSHAMPGSESAGIPYDPYKIEKPASGSPKAGSDPTSLGSSAGAEMPDPTSLDDFSTVGGHDLSGLGAPGSGSGLEQSIGEGNLSGGDSGTLVGDGLGLPDPPTHPSDLDDTDLDGRLQAQVGGLDGRHPDSFDGDSSGPDIGQDAMGGGTNPSLNDFGSGSGSGSSQSGQGYDSGSSSWVKEQANSTKEGKNVEDGTKRSLKAAKDASGDGGGDSGGGDSGGGDSDGTASDPDAAPLVGDPPPPPGEPDVEYQEGPDGGHEPYGGPPLVSTEFAEKHEEIDTYARMTSDITLDPMADQQGANAQLEVSSAAMIDGHIDYGEHGGPVEAGDGAEEYFAKIFEAKIGERFNEGDLEGD